MLTIQKNVDLTNMTTLKMKAVAARLCVAKSREDIIEAQKEAQSQNQELLILGGGSNTVLLQEQVDKFVVRNQYVQKKIVSENDEYVDLSISSGYPVGLLVNQTVKDGLSGFEYQLGLPGTVGGAIYMNSKWTKPFTYFGDNLISANLLTKEGTIKTVERDYFNFAYDYSILQDTGEILLEAVFRMKRMDREKLDALAKEAFAYRKETQPMGIATSGCFYQNLSDEEVTRIGESTNSAGNLIDKAGLKGVSQGSFVVSDHHANFILNQGGGQPEDLKKLLIKIKSTVKDKFNVELKEEVRLIQ